MSRYLDTSAITPLFVRDGHSDAISRWLVDNPEHLTISDFGAAEFAAVVGRLRRMRQLGKRDANAALSNFDDWRNRSTSMRPTMSSDIATCERLVRDFNLKLGAPDALHLAVAMTSRLSMVTFDRRLAGAAGLVGHAVAVPR